VYYYYCTLLLTVIKIIYDIIAAAEEVKQEAAYVGQTARLPCWTTVKYWVDWRRLDTLESDHDYIYTNGQVWQKFRSRFSVDVAETTDKVDEYTLVIANVDLNDTAYYLCIENAGIGTKHFFHLNVTGMRKKRLRCDSDCRLSVLARVLYRHLL